MSSGVGNWRSGEILAFTEREGPGRPPSGPSGRATGTLAAVLGVTFVGVMFSDTLCPEHRAWVITLAGLAFAGIISAFVGLVRGWGVAPLLTVAASLAGVGIGLLDTVHSPTRGRLVALAFAVATVLAAYVSWRAHRLGRWDRAQAPAAPVASLPAEPAATPEASLSAPTPDEAPIRP
jgi:hypothetical protein